MDANDIIDVLNQLLAPLCRSLPMYLHEARPYCGRDDQQAAVVLHNLVADQQVLAERVAQAIIERGGRPEPGRFPTRFVDINDVSLDCLLPMLVRQQRHNVTALQSCAVELSDEPQLHALAEQVRANAAEHLQALEELTPTASCGW